LPSTYQIADHDLAVTVGRGGLGRGRLCAGTASGLGVLLDSTNRGGRGRASGRTARVGATASASALGLGDVVESLVELARHFDVWLNRGLWKYGLG
jgi:hypothetical protein